MAKKKSNLKSFIELVKKLKKTERGKAILFLGFYFIFFLVLIIFIRISASNPKTPIDYELTAPETSFYTYDKILDGNYDFTYTINIDNNVFVYSGEKFGDIELFSLNGVNYFYDGVDYYTLDSNNIWVEATNPYTYSDFINFTRLGEVIADATYISKTEFGDGSALFNYLVSSNSIVKVIEDVDTDIEEIPNSVVFTASGDDLHLEKIELDLSSYGKFKGVCIDSFKITLEYLDFNGNKESINPLE